MDEHPLSHEEKQLLLSPAAASPSSELQFAASRGTVDNVLPRRNRAADSGASPNDALEQQLHSIRLLHDGVARRFASGLTDLLNRPVEAEVTLIELISYSQFVHSRSIPTCLLVLKAPPLSSELLLDFGPAILYPLLDCLLGGGREPCTVPERPPTEIEQRLARRLAEVLLGELHDAWQHVLAVDLSIDRVESHATQVRMLAPAEQVIAITFRATVGQQSGELTLCLPVKSIQKMAHKLAAQLTADTECTPSAEPGRPEGLSELVVTLGHLQLSPEQLQELKPGDLLTTDLPPESAVRLAIDGVPRFRCRPGSHAGYKAVVVE